MLRAVYCGLALGLLAAMAWAKTPAPRCQPAHFQQLVWAVEQGQVTSGQASLLDDAAAVCKAPGNARHARATRPGSGTQTAQLAPGGAARR